MTRTEAPWTDSAAWPQDVSLVRIPLPVLDALARGDSETAERLTDVELGRYVVGPDCLWLWQIRSEQLVASPDDHEWVTRLIVDGPSGDVVGVAGFHGAPDRRGMVEIGYRIDPDRRRRGYARSALQVLLAIARADPRVDVVRATVSPDNLASRALLDQYGFREVGEQWDDVDGLETIFEVSA
ncbi:GNAT family N-acetyltransferase [Aeromicrobium choanae]|uniref:Acetyltransferase (GNAT) domain-containing protein n=1 Tax=Aeromicrobium choanae TaxID=1736691 RepID=A0A1T4Z8K0_9ACTN|nr:GNAT family N-acetyltransferase [Aeromicrobium choanae]SKB10304.1 Acetyltransferase (GNAT) domain-containing protein [Aeromicrobium choanae]